MKPVIKGEKITAQKFNEVIDAINNSVGLYSQYNVDPIMPDGYVIVGNITSELGGEGNETFTLSSVQLLNTWQPNGELIGDRTITENLDELTSFYLVSEMPSERHPVPTSNPSVLTNVEARDLDPQLEWDKRLLYEVSCNVSTGMFEIIKDYRIANGICSSGGTGGGTGGDCRCDLSAYYTEYDDQGNRNNKIATWTNGKEGDDNKTVDIYAPAGGGGGEGGDLSVDFTGTDDSKTDKNKSFKFKAAQYSNVQVKCSGNEIEIGVFYI